MTDKKMPYSYAEISLIGNLGSNIRTRTAKSGRQIASVNIAVNQSHKTSSGEWESDPTMWFEVVDFGDAGLSGSKGDRIQVHGRLALDVWTDKEGKERQTYKVLAKHCEMMERKGEQADEGFPE